MSDNVLKCILGWAWEDRGMRGGKHSLLTLKFQAESLVVLLEHY